MNYFLHNNYKTKVLAPHSNKPWMSAHHEASKIKDAAGRLFEVKLYIGLTIGPQKGLHLYKCYILSNDKQALPSDKCQV